VTLIHRRDSFRAEKILQDRLFKNPKVTVLWDTVLEEIMGEKAPAPLVKAVRLRNAKSGKESTLPTDGVFIAIGHSPNTELFKGKLAMDSEGYLLTKPDSTATDIAGIYAAGDVQDKIFRQAVTAAGTGCMAALEAEKWLASQEARVAQAAE
jgi:thioredoxin reductase (NADPH)